MTRSVYNPAFGGAVVMKRLIQRLVKGDPRRRSRLHDYAGNRMDVGGLVHLPSCLFWTLARRVGWRPIRPWLGYRAVRRLAGLIQPDWRILEFGSGLSTVWLAERAALVVAIDENPEWHEIVVKGLARRRITNVDYRLAEDPETYVAVPGYPDRTFDLAIVDGRWRASSAEKALRAVRPGGWIFFDNSDVPDEDHQRARSILAAAAEGQPEIFIELTPFQFCVNQGLLVRVGK